MGRRCTWKCGSADWGQPNANAAKATRPLLQVLLARSAPFPEVLLCLDTLPPGLDRFWVPRDVGRSLCRSTWVSAVSYCLPAVHRRQTRSLGAAVGRWLPASPPQPAPAPRPPPVGAERSR